jgi:hypothetical protein
VGIETADNPIPLRKNPSWVSEFLAKEREVAVGAHFDIIACISMALV